MNTLRGHFFLSFPRNLTCVAGVLIVFLLTTAPVRAQAIFDRHVLHEVNITLAETQWFDSLQTFYDQALNGADNRFLPCTLIIDGDTLHEVGLRFKGKYSNYGFPGVKKPFRLDFNTFVDGQKFQGLKKLNLHNLAGDPSFLREFMAYDLFHSVDVEAPRASFAKLYINGAYWGCYELVEEPDKTFLDQHFGNKEGNLFEAVKTTQLSWKGEDPTAYPELELKTDSSAAAWDNLIDWLDLFNNYYRFDFQQQLSDRFDTDNFMRLLAADVLISNLDAYWSNGRNFFVYDNPETGKLHWIPWDYNLSFWDVNLSPIPLHGSNQTYMPFIYRIYENAFLRKKYLTQFCHLLENEFSNYDFDAISQEMYVLIRPAVEADTNKFYTTWDFYANRTQGVTVSMLRNNVPTDVFLPGLTDLFAKRKNELRKSLFVAGCDCDNLEESETLSGVAFPNPFSDEVTLYIEEDMKGLPAQVSITDLSGKVVYDETCSAASGSYHCRLDHLQQGIYIARVEAVGKTYTTKILKQ